MKRKYRVEVESFNKRNKYRWAFRMFFISINLSLFFGFISQTLLSDLGIIVATICISLFIAMAVIFDMLGIAIAMADIDVFKKWEKENIKGASIGLKMCYNSEKVCSFCGDVVGDICSTLCGAGGACIVVALTSNIKNPNIVILISISVSALIAGITIFFKALMKEHALKKSNLIILKFSKILNLFIK